MASTTLAVDEKVDKKRYHDLTAVSDGVRILHVAEGRREASLAGFLQTLTPNQKHRIRWVSMAMWAPYIRAVTNHLPHGARNA